MNDLPKGTLSSSHPPRRFLVTIDKTVRLNDGHSIPRIGFGVWRLEENKAPDVVAAAIEAGYRHIDTAQGYDNEAGVGEGIKKSGIAREELFVTSKLRTSHQGFDKSQQSLKESLQRLGLDYLDLFLIHWPAPQHDRYAETWKGLVEAQKQGLVRSIGVSNFLPEHLERIIEETGVTPAVNQVETNPKYQQKDQRAWNKQHGIVTESYSPLGGDGAALLKNEAITGIADRLGKSPAQVVIRWHLQNDLVVLPKTDSSDRAKQNYDVWDFELSDGDLKALAKLDDPNGKSLPQPNENNDLF
jgi:2,5-diketo-D-gluconate reductase A